MSDRVQREGEMGRKGKNDARIIKYAYTIQVIRESEINWTRKWVKKPTGNVEIIEAKLIV